MIFNMKSLAYYTAMNNAINAVYKAKCHGILPWLWRVDVRCVDCGAPATDYDHRNYDKPLDVDPVCHKCNCRRGPARFKEEGD
jgi:hypothetical protein